MYILLLLYLLVLLPYCLSASLLQQFIIYNVMYQFPFLYTSVASFFEANKNNRTFFSEKRENVRLS